MATQTTCHTCVYAHWDPGLWMRTLWSGFAAGPTCGNQPDSYGRMKECPCGRVCRNYRARPPVPTGENVKQIPLTKGYYAYVDAADYEWLNQWHWRAYSPGYAGRYEKGKMIYMHREIMRPPKGKVVDHVSGNGFDNTRANMRNVTRRQNMYNKGKNAATSSIYKGVCRHKPSGKWYARIWSMGKRISLGYFTDEAEAARAYDSKAVELFGEFARLNFPEEWPPQRRARVHTQHRKESRKIRAGKTVTSKENRRGPVGEKSRIGRRGTRTTRKVPQS